MCDKTAPLANNAFYCSPEYSPVSLPNGYVAWDEHWLLSFYDKDGDAGVATIVAHEWGHAMQDLLGWESTSTKSYERSADCLAGVWAQHAAQEHLLDETDLADALDALIDVSDPADAHWFNSDAHGNKFQRNGSFYIGYTDGPKRCTPEQQTG